MARRKAASSATNGRKLIAFAWYGGKFSHLKWLLPLLPKCHHYCEPFAGSAAVLLNRPPSPIETCNDVDGELVNFFRVLRDHKDELVEKISLTPFSREEFGLACKRDPGADPLERARRFFVRARQVRSGIAQRATIGNWAYCQTNSRAGMSAGVSNWLGGVRKLPEVAERLLRVQIDNRPALEVIRLYDSPQTLFYCDPPYVHEARQHKGRTYHHEMADREHVELAGALNAAAGMVAISGYDCDLMRSLYPAPKWRKHVRPARWIPSGKSNRSEVLWMNYDEMATRHGEHLLTPLYQSTG